PIGGNSECRHPPFCGQNVGIPDPSAALLVHSAKEAAPMVEPASSSVPPVEASTAGVVVQAAKAAYVETIGSGGSGGGGASVVGEYIEDQRGGQPSEPVVESTLPLTPAAGEEEEERKEVKQTPPPTPAVDTVQAQQQQRQQQQRHLPRPTTLSPAAGTIQAARLRSSRLPHLGLRWEPRQVAA
ncbi:unnamed protein product, partial [Ectocarpus sp. 12 AP-2014]